MNLEALTKEQLIEHVSSLINTVEERDAQITALLETVEKLKSTMKWRCRVGNEEFITDDEDVANEWKEDGFNVEKLLA